MKKILIALVALFTIGNFSASAQKIAHIDYIAVMDSLDTYKKALIKSEELAAGFQETMESLQQEYAEKAQAYQEEVADMAPIIQQMRQKEIQDIELLSQQMQGDYQNNLQTIQDRYFVPLEEWLKKAVAIVGESKGFDYVLYYDEENSIFWVNPNKGVDVTNEVITEMLKLEKANPVVTPGE